MLEVLCGNKNVQRILIFLFVNGKCYGTQLHKAMKTSLTPIQKALNRLESGGLILSFYEGKTRLYQFNPAYPLLSEVEMLLKKAYTLLPSHLKKDYYVFKEELGTKPFADKQQILLAFWKKLSEIKELSFIAKTKSKEESGWNRRGKGTVDVSEEGSNILIFQEKGSWQNKEGADMDFSNVFRWTLDRNAAVIALEHLRRGKDHPAFLFHLAPSSSRSLSSVNSHLCGGDTYLGQVHFDPHNFHLKWRVIGPKKNEEIDYYYS
jgi:hypothetical protein